jgi:hypothetical protein
MASNPKKGDLVKVGDSLGVITHLYVELEGFDHDDLDDEHLGVWYGESENGVHKIRTVPAKYCIPQTRSIFYH